MKTKFKKGDKVKMYGCGDGAGTFWIGGVGKIVGFQKEWDIAIVQPLEFPKERHPMHYYQLRKIRKA